MERINIYIEEEGAIAPTRKFPTDAGMDFYANGYYEVKPGSMKKIGTGVSVRLVPGWMMLLKPKSRNNYLLGAGVVDPEYQGEILFKIYNPRPESLIIHKGDAIGQGIILEAATPAVIVNYGKQIRTVQKTARGATGGIHNDGAS